MGWDLRVVDIEHNANNKQYSDHVEDDGCDLGGGQCNHESDAKAIFRFRSEDLPLSHSSHHRDDCHVAGDDFSIPIIPIIC